jgi:hypothetical protein
MNFSWCKAQLCCIGLAAAECTGQDVLKVGIVIDELQQRLAAGPVLANAEEIFCCGIDCCDQQILIEKYDACV